MINKRSNDSEWLEKGYPIGFVKFGIIRIIRFPRYEA